MTRSHRTKWLALLTTATLIPLASCSNNGLNLAKVRGKVTYKGQPVQKGTVFFMPDEAKGTVGPSAMGGISSDGSYVLSTEESGDGVIVGLHKVGITGFDPNPVSSGPAAPDPETNPEGYMDAKAQASAVVRGQAPRTARKDADENLFVGRDGKKWRYAIPKKVSNPDESGVTVKVTSARTINFEIDDAGNVQISP